MEAMNALWDWSSQFRTLRVCIGFSLSAADTYITNGTGRNRHQSTILLRYIDQRRVTGLGALFDDDGITSRGQGRYLNVHLGQADKPRRHAREDYRGVDAIDGRGGHHQRVRERAARCNRAGWNRIIQLTQSDHID